MIKSRSGSRLHMGYYWGLYALLVLSIAGFALSFRYVGAWQVFRQLYFTIVIAYVWYVFVLLFLGEVRKPRIKQYNGESIAVLVPVYNEDSELFVQCIRSVLRCEGNKTVFVLDDGSTKGLNKAKLQAGCDKFGVHLMLFPENRGKRHVLFDGVKALNGAYDYVVTIDSDTVLAPDALVNIVGAFDSPQVGAASGEVYLLNEQQNWLTRMVGAYYWLGLDMFKKAQSTLGMVVCCSGCLSCYRGDLVANIIDEFVEQEFRGEPCTHSEDRYLTNLVLRDGYKVKFAETAKSYTRTPHTVRTFLKQQMRWKRGFVREATFLLTFTWKTNPILFIQTIMYDLTLPFVVFGMVLSLIVSLIGTPSEYVTGILPFYLVFTLVRNLPLVIRAPKKLPGMLIFSVFSDLCLYWQNIYALLTTKNKGWLTR